MGHANARTTVYARRLLVDRVLAGHRPGEVAKQLGVSRQTVYKWVRRWRAEGAAGLFDRSSRPRRSPPLGWTLSDDSRCRLSRGLPHLTVRERRPDSGGRPRASAYGCVKDLLATATQDGADQQVGPTRSDVCRSRRATGQAAPAVSPPLHPGRCSKPQEVHSDENSVHCTKSAQFLES